MSEQKSLATDGAAHHCSSLVADGKRRLDVNQRLPLRLWHFAVTQLIENHRLMLAMGNGGFVFL